MHEVRLQEVLTVCRFDAEKENDWRVNFSLSSLLAYKRVAADPLYQRRFL